MIVFTVLQLSTGGESAVKPVLRPARWREGLGCHCHATLGTATGAPSGHTVAMDHGDALCERLGEQRQVRASTTIIMIDGNFVIKLTTTNRE